jgi:hypothetical protein
MEKRQYYVFLGLIFELFGLVLAFVYAGHYLDEKYGWKGLGVAGGGILALLIWVVHLVQAFKQPPSKDS